ncbi:MAG: extracellular solute-binding protein [Pseudomonadota bacterium]
MDTIIYDYLDRIVGPFINPQKRIFVGYLLSALAIAVALQLFLARKPLQQALSEIFAKKVWFSRSAFADYKILLINQFIMMGIAPRLISKLVIATFIFETLHIWLNGRWIIWPDAPAWMIGCLFTLALFLLDDATKYLLHRALHRWPALWCFHQVHHSAEVLTPITVYRTHPVEAVLFAVRSALVQAVVVALFIFFFADRATLVTVLGANVFLFFFNLAGSNLRHSHIWISYGTSLEHWLISPAQHQIHHSLEERHYDRNFGAVLAIWDRLGGSLCLARPDEKPSQFGVHDAGVDPHDLRTLYLSPFANTAACLPASVKKGLTQMRNVLSHPRARWLCAGCLAFAIGIVAIIAPVSASELNIYSHRQPFLIEPFLKAYTKKTGTKINVVYASRGLAQRLQAEGKNSPADVVLTVDIARLYVYADKDLLAEVDSATLLKNIPEHLRDPGKRWFAFSKRARVIAVSKNAKDLTGIKRYEDLADPRWKGRICSRPGSHVYNRALIASIINAAGSAEAQKWAAALVGNLARRPQGNDRAQVKAIYEGVCDIAIINNYYFGKLKTSDKPEQREWANAVTLIFPNQSGRGTHVNISGGGVAKHSKNREEAQRFLEFLTSKEAQDLYGAINFEYPVNADVPVSDDLKSWGTFKEDKMPIAKIAELAPEAQKIIDRVGW